MLGGGRELSCSFDDGVAIRPLPMWEMLLVKNRLVK